MRSHLEQTGCKVDRLNCGLQRSSWSGDWDLAGLPTVHRYESQTSALIAQLAEKMIPPKPPTKGLFERNEENFQTAGIATEHPGYHIYSKFYLSAGHYCYIHSYSISLTSLSYRMYKCSSPLPVSTRETPLC